jgi:hypothetical protein
MWSAISGLSWDGACSRRELRALEIVAAVWELGIERRGLLYGKVCLLEFLFLDKLLGRDG